MVAVTKIFVVVMLLVFVDLIIQQAAGTDYGIIAIAIFLGRALGALLLIIAHALTHWNDIPTDFIRLILGLIALMLWSGEVIVNALFRLLRLPFELIFGLLDQIGVGSAIRVHIDGVGGFLIDFRTLTWQLKFGEFTDVNILWVSGIFLTMDNTIGFSVFGIDNNVRVFLSIGENLVAGELIATYGSQGAFGVMLDFLDIVWTAPPDFVCEAAWTLNEFNPLTPPNSQSMSVACPAMYAELGLRFTGTWDFLDAFNDLLRSVPIPSFSEWVDSVYADYLPSAVLSNIQVIIQHYSD